MTIWEVTIRLHQMGCSTTSSGCSGRGSANFWIQDGTQGKSCSQWQEAVSLLEKRNPKPYPYLELLVIDSNQILTDEGVWVYPAGSVSCNGALDWN
jgi:fructose-1,6-bisphosphatase